MLAHGPQHSAAHFSHGEPLGSQVRGCLSGARGGWEIPPELQEQPQGSETEMLLSAPFKLPASKPRALG